MTISGGSLPSNVSLSYGLDEDKPDNPKEGAMYLATDVNILYVCYVAGEWVNANPPLPQITEVMSSPSPSTADTLIFYRQLIGVATDGGGDACGTVEKYGFTIQNDFTAFLRFFTRGYDGTGAGVVTHRMCINGVSAYYFSSNHRDGRTDTATHEFKKGDVVKIHVTRTTTNSSREATLSIFAKSHLRVDGVEFVPVSVDSKAFLIEGT